MGVDSFSLYSTPDDVELVVALALIAAHSIRSMCYLVGESVCMYAISPP
jgi:hypothetical protein